MWFEGYMYACTPPHAAKYYNYNYTAEHDICTTTWCASYGIWYAIFGDGSRSQLDLITAYLAQVRIMAPQLQTTHSSHQDDAHLESGTPVLNCQIAKILIWQYTLAIPVTNHPFQGKGPPLITLSATWRNGSTWYIDPSTWRTPFSI